MKILIVNTYYFPDIIGGAEVSIKKLAEGLADNGIDVHVICTGTNDIIEDINKVKVHRVKLSNIYQPIELRGKSNTKKLVGRVNDIYNILNRNKLNDSINEISPDVIHVNNLYGISPIIWDIASEMNIKIVHTIRDYYLMCPRITMMKGEKSCDNRNIGCKIFSDFNKRISKKVDFVTAPSQFTLNKFLKEGFFINAQSQKVFNAIDFDENKIEENFKVKMNKYNNEIKFVFIGTLNKSKGIDILLDVFSKNKNDRIKLLIAGKGPLESLVKDYCKNDSRIIYNGFMNEEEVNNMLQLSDVLIAPSVWNEPFGRVIIDGYKNIMPAIAGNFGGLAEIIKDNVTGKLINPHDRLEFSFAIEYFSNRENIKNMLGNCLCELNNYSIKEQVKQFIYIYKSLI